MNSIVKQFSFEQDEPLRLDKFLKEKVAGFSRSQLQSLIEAGKVWVDDETVLKPAFKLEQGQNVRVELPEPEQELLQAENIPLEVIYQDEHVVVINKPAGMIVHPGAGHQTGTVVNAALYRWPEMRQVGDPQRPGVVHRLDKETSGVLILARTQEAYTWLIRQFKSRRTEKTYLALVDGHPPTPIGRIEAPVGRNPQHRQRMAALYAGEGRKAVTEYRSIQSFRDHELLEVRPVTGRTHQIRVHLAFLGCPVTGDRVYGHRKPTLPLDRFFLHAASIKITLPGEKTPTEFQAKLPQDLQKVLSDLSLMEMQ
jgi:23S rRNA pseudouridine1911/1915/1917 synthase